MSVLQNRAYLSVNACGSELSQRGNAAGRADQKGRQRHKIDTKVQQGTPGQIGGEKSVGWIWSKVLSQVGDDACDLTQDPNTSRVGQQTRRFG
jgi:hypothetical protein